MFLLLAGCGTPAALYPVDPCRVAPPFGEVSGSASCAAAGQALEVTFDWAETTRVGGTQGDGWEGLSFYTTGTSADGGTISVGHRPGGTLGLYARSGASELVVGYLPAGSDTPEAPYVALTDGVTTCDATGSGDVVLTGVPTAWVNGGEWGMTFDGGVEESDTVASDWEPPWPATCPLDPRAWATVRVTARCGATVGAEIQFLAPTSYTVELDALGGVGGVSATWGNAFAATCDGAEITTLDGSLQGEGGVLRLYTPVLTVLRGEGGWSLEETACGECEAGWEVEVEGLPEM